MDYTTVLYRRQSLKYPKTNSLSRKPWRSAEQKKDPAEHKLASRGMESTKFIPIEDGAKKSPNIRRAETEAKAKEARPNANGVLNHHPTRKTSVEHEIRHALTARRLGTTPKHA